MQAVARKGKIWWKRFEKGLKRFRKMLDYYSQDPRLNHKQKNEMWAWILKYFLSEKESGWSMFKPKPVLSWMTFCMAHEHYSRFLVDAPPSGWLIQSLFVLCWWYGVFEFDLPLFCDKKTNLGTGFSGSSPFFQKIIPPPNVCVSWSKPTSQHTPQLRLMLLKQRQQSMPVKIPEWSEVLAKVMEKAM